MNKKTVHLTSRQNEVAALIAQGMGRATIAGELSISLSTIDKQLRALKNQFNAASQSELALRCAEFFNQPTTANDDPTTGSLKRHSSRGSVATDFSNASDFNALFDALENTLGRFGITHVTYSHIERCSSAGETKHLATRWSFPDDVTFNFDIPVEHNLAFKHAMSSWEPALLDLEEMIASDLYRYVPDIIRKQNDHFISAGLVRGVTYVVPGLHAHDRFVASVLMQHATREEFVNFVSKHIEAVHNILVQFRNAHVGMADVATNLTEKERSVLSLYADDHTPDSIAKALGVSRRAIERIMTDVRAAYGVETNAAAIARFVRERYDLKLPF